MGKAVSQSEVTRHNYEYEVELGSDTAPSRVIRLTGSNKRVLEVGAGPGSITKHLIYSNNCDVVVVEIDPTAIAKLEAFCSSIYSLDLNDPAWPEALAGEEKFDVVIAADVLEHVYDPLTTLKAMTSLLNCTGEIILSLPHVGHSVIAACLFDEDFEYRDWGLLDRTHIRFFGLKNINALYTSAGLSIVEAEFVVRTPEETEFAHRWERLPSELRTALSMNKYGYVYQVVSKARPVERAAAASIDLMTLPVEGHVAKTGLMEGLKTTARRKLRPETREQIKRLAQRMGLRN